MGLAAMFIMMNAARLGVRPCKGWRWRRPPIRNAVHYARDRRPGPRADRPAEPGEKADTLMVHPDVRRMLMEAKAWTEGLRALCLWGRAPGRSGA